jgi:uroporphyrinogen decarboxylase
MNDRFLRACWHEPVDCTPVWFMRQAGRSSPSYRAIRSEHGVLEIAKTPALAAEVAMQPVREIGVDAAILFCDLLIPLEAMGASVRIEDGVGPVLDPPIRSEEDVDRLHSVDPDRDLAFVAETVRRLRAKLDVPLIGFAGAPFTLASYLIEGGASRDFEATKRFMHERPVAWTKLMHLLADGVASFLRMQADAGAQALQLFDSWAGALGPRDYRAKVEPYTRAVFDGIREAAVPTIHFGTGTAGFLDAFRAAGGDVIGVDWRIPLDRAWSMIGENLGIQGNLDPAALLGPATEWRDAALDVLERADGRPGHVFNLGHGVLPSTPLECLRGLVELVHVTSQR